MGVAPKVVGLHTGAMGSWYDIPCDKSDVFGQGVGYSDTDPVPGYQGRGHFRGHGILLLMLETLLVRRVALARQWRFHLWPAVVHVLLVLFSSPFSSPLSFFFSAAFSSLPLSVKNLAIKCRAHLPLRRAAKSAPGIVLTCGTIRTGTGTSGDGVCPERNRRRGCGFGLINRRWRCERSARLRMPHTRSPQRMR